MDDTLDKTGRNLVGSPLEKREQKMTILFQNILEKIKITNDLNDHDKDDILKPIEKTNNNDNQPIHTERSKISKISFNQEKENNQELVCYTNEKRASPNNSFYEEKKDEILQIIEICNEESRKETIQMNEDNFVYQEDDDDGIEEFEEEDEMENPISYRESLKKDIISQNDDYKPRQKNEIDKINSEETGKAENLRPNLNLKMEIKFKCR